jgi:predicted metal-dependent peptidase
MRDEKNTEVNIDDITLNALKEGVEMDDVPIYEWLDENKPTCRLIINFTDGETDIPKDINFNTLWVISTGGTDRVVKDTGEVIKL